MSRKVCLVLDARSEKITAVRRVSKWGRLVGGSGNCGHQGTLDQCDRTRRTRNQLEERKPVDDGSE